MQHRIFHSTRHRALELDPVAFGIVQVNGRPLALGAIARHFLAAANAMGREMRRDRGGVKRRDPQAEMIEIGGPPVLDLPSAGPVSSAGTISISA